jgi:hypothetical protein
VRLTAELYSGRTDRTRDCQRKGFIYRAFIVLSMRLERGTRRWLVGNLDTLISQLSWVAFPIDISYSLQRTSQQQQACTLHYMLSFYTIILTILQV